MHRKTIIAVFALLGALPGFANTTRFPAGQVAAGQAAAGQAEPVLRLMNDREFAVFLGRLDSDLLRSQLQLKKMDVKSLSLDVQEKQDLERSYSQCLQSLDNTRDEIQKLSQKQTLKLDLFLLIDLNELARNLDALDEVLINPIAVNGTSGAQKSLGYAREVLGIDGSLATEISTFQHHFIAFTGVVDASLEPADSDASQPPAQK
ncbi:MAG TPA: hypothetical protein VGP19_15075 [Candidatus Acidoferrales bacterium]|jgi:hypothetical protein|nr:hypothetical protein [Candidatus Acidoferrales bacterium]